MYSPRIAEYLIPRLYEAAKARRIAMTKLVHELLVRGLDQMMEEERDQNEPKRTRRDQAQ